MFQHYKFSLDDSAYHDKIKAHPAHYNSMRAKPILPQALIENNLIGLRTFPNTWIRSKDEWKYFRDERKFRKRCLFEIDQNNKNEKVHMASLDALSNQHLLCPKLKLPHEDDVYRVLGQKRNLIDKRNGFEEFSPGDKSYRAVEYSNDFFKLKTRNWREEKYKLPRKQSESFPNLSELLDLSQKKIADVFSNHVDFDYEQDPFIEKKDELDVVKSLDTWRPNTPLQLPFKVLDVGDKALKYRPRVTR